jgi:hypothetical protein
MANALANPMAVFLLLLVFTTSSINAQNTADAPAPEITPIAKYIWRVTVGNRSPDCFERLVLLVNDEFSPTLEVYQGDLLEVSAISCL